MAETAEASGDAAVESNTASMLAAFQDDVPPAESAEAQIDQQTQEMLAAADDAPADGGSPPANSGAGATSGAPVGKAPSKEGNTVRIASDGKDDRLIKVKGLDKQQLCIDLLMVGCVQSFVDFFYITHRKQAPNEAGAPDSEARDVDIPEETLVFLKETLEAAESARRAANYQQCFENYNTLAEYFEKVPDLKSAMYFYQRCADVAAEVDAKESISKACLNLGTCEEQGNNWQSAMQFHEKALYIATSADSLPLQIKAASRLTKVYQVLAENCEKEGRDSEATSLYERCRDCAQLSKDPHLEGTACHKLGLSKYKTGHYEEAIELQKQYLDIARMHDDRVGESAARGALAQAYEAISGTQEAIKQLENLLNVASEAGELKAQASACLNLGVLYNGREDHEKSVELLEQHFDLARQIGDRKLIDSARVVLGIVRGHGKLKAYIELVNSDIERLLRWKSKRATLDTQ
uniref:Tetratricopeptide repeat protein 29 n=1 Tax=Zooxanthella nutricula TaxID=1333877 RepID=A0A6U6PGJ7_9DINO|mmetsp:Transcript_58743/g.179177  ORF Transcript_58743/g.179177 Transcript_58743/m.179177 type:complete len:465 (+) Transcript_58743:75-1469(+)